jgi:tetratricopeptide (TPR) repeat protein
VTAASDRADHLLALGRAQEALDLLLADGETARDSRALVAVSRCQHELGHYQQALDVAGAALAIDPDAVGGHLMRAISLLSLRWPVDALPPASRAVALAPEHAGGHRVMSWILAELGRFNEATAHAERARSLEPDDPAGWVALARVQLAQRRWHDAAMSARAALAIDPEDEDAKVALSIAQVAGRGDRGRVEAMETLVGALRDNPDQEHIRELLFEVAWAGGVSIQMIMVWAVLAAATGGVGLVAILVIWSFGAVRRWRTVPPDVRRLIWADRRARWKIIVAASALALLWVALIATIVLVVLFEVTAAERPAAS